MYEVDYSKFKPVVSPTNRFGNIEVDPRTQSKSLGPLDLRTFRSFRCIDFDVPESTCSQNDRLPFGTE